MQSHEIRCLKNELHDMGERIDALPDKLSTIPDQVVKKLQDNIAIDGVAPITRDELANVLSQQQDTTKKLLEETVTRLVGDMRARVPEAREEEPPQERRLRGGQLGLDGFRTWMWGRPRASFHMVPEGWSLPVCNTSTLWNLWLMGNAAEQLQPYRQLRGSDLQSPVPCGRRQCKKLHENETNKWHSYLTKAKFVMARVLDKCGTSAKALSEANAQDREGAFRNAYQELMVDLYPQESNERRDARRLGDLTYLRLYDKLKKLQKEGGLHDPSPPSPHR